MFERRGHTRKTNDLWSPSATFKEQGLKRETYNNLSKVKNDKARLLYLFVVVVTSISSTFLFSSCHVIEAKGWNNFLFEKHDLHAL